MRIKISFIVTAEMEIDDDCTFDDLDCEDLAHRALKLSPKKLKLDDYYLENLEPLKG